MTFVWCGVGRFKVSLGHKTNHSFRFNAHPVLGTIMAVVASRLGGDLSLVQIQFSSASRLIQEKNESGLTVANYK